MGREGSWTTVDADDEELGDSLSAGAACLCRLAGSSRASCRETGGFECKGLTCRIRDALLFEKTVPGEYDDMDVGVDDTLKGPGDSEYLVDGVVDRAYWGVGSGKISVGSTSESW